MQKLTKDEMKKVMGGIVAPPANCLTSCHAWSGGADGGMQYGTCTQGTTNVNGHPMLDCTCSVSNGDCYAS